MNRLLVFAMIATVGQASAAFAEDSLLASGSRHTQQIARADSKGSTPAAIVQAGLVVPISRNAVANAVANAASNAASNDAPALQVAQGTLAHSGMRKRTKMMIAIGLGVGFAAGAYTIDHHVLDVTPSSLGTRQD